MNKMNSIIGIAIGVVTASFGGLVRGAMALDKTPDLPFEHFGIVLPFLLCFLLPILGGFSGWVGARIANRSSESKVRACLGGLLGGIVTTLIFIPYPIAI